MAAFMPESRIKPTKPTVAALTVGQLGYIDASYIWIKPDRSAFVSKDAELQSRKEGITVRISRLEDGYHLKLDGCERRWEVMDNNWSRLTERHGQDFLKPLQSIEE
jgi:hypothetical protein